ncbi:hypothetical protein DRH29_00110 [candidate division Kazan bacterium]|uniref:Apea-like HEPN domain-containing protein n=1 Tax=candidate division Kazan bacterium TaxID=2202143 RepID=A0A420ZDG6_UNCK3|nr:MAG: hypothetical protein DRH29_00110 [candidate division Kazan bacterium]
MRINPYKPKDFDEFWESRVNKWMVDGIRSCVVSQTNIGATTLIFCYIDFFGSLLKRRGSPRERFYIMVDKYFAPYNKKYNTYKCTLYENFRCSLVHEGIMKKGTGIFRSDNPEDRDYQHFGNHNGALFLDLIQLSNDFYSAIKDLKRDIDSDKKLKNRVLKRVRDDLKWSLPEEINS